MREGLREVNGTMHYANGDSFEGEWAHDKRVGKRGKLTMVSAATGGSSKITGQFQKDQVDGQIEYEDCEGNIFKTEAAAVDNQIASNLNSVDKSMVSAGSRSQ